MPAHMLASKNFGIRRTSKDDWFDTIVNADTELFVDPFLIFKDSAEFWRTAHDEVIEHFNRAFLLIAEGNSNPKSIQYKKALALLIAHEPKEFCLGYTARGTQGAGSGWGYAKSIAAAIADAIARGIVHPRHFEELGILNEGIGADRISDITCTILKRRLIEYTREIAVRHRIPTANHRLFAGAFDDRRLRWEASEVDVPTNPSSKGPLLFVPTRFLRELPALNADEWWANYENEQLRQDVNYEVLGHVDKKTIVSVARRNPEAVRRWTIQKEAESATAYDFDRDPKGVWRWDLETASFAEANPLRIHPPKSDQQFFGVVESVIAQFKLFIEEQGGWKLLWDRGHAEEKPEHAAQLLFRGIATSYCKANNISFDPEVNFGRGPIDFKFSNGYEQRAHLEVKKLHNGEFWEGLDKQLPSYMRSDEVNDGWFLAIRYRPTGISEKRAKELPNRVRVIARKTGLRLRFAIVDARPVASASKISRGLVS
jgi:hypothetical protein